MSAALADLASLVRSDPDAVLAEHARRSLLAFCRRLFPGYQTPGHVRTIAAHLEAVERGDVRRLVVTMPPRFGKSLTASELFPSWYMGKDRDRRVIGASHTGDLAYEFSRRVREIVTDEAYPFGAAALARDRKAVGSWGWTRRLGGYQAAGVGGSITGRGANLLMIDDPVKSAEEALSKSQRERTWRWYSGTARPRLQPGGAVVVIGTRWHHDDLIGRLIARQGTDDAGGRWRLVKLAALDSEGRSLWPEAFPATEAEAEERRARGEQVTSLEETRGDVGEYNWNAQYMGSPTSEEGELVKKSWWDANAYDDWELPNPIPYLWQTWDTAYSKSSFADYSVCVTWAVTAGTMYVLDVQWFQLDFPQLKETAGNLAYQAAIRWGHPVDIIRVEAAGSGISLVQEMQAATLRYPIVLWAIDPRDPIVRVTRASGYIESGRIRVPRRAEWRERWDAEWTAFPFGAHDDAVFAGVVGILSWVQPPEEQTVGAPSAVHTYRGGGTRIGG